tara:strand:- start:206 stop:328 length:123 start_codon:yes stop_codon:yes gene_type:complete
MRSAGKEAGGGSGCNSSLVASLLGVRLGGITSQLVNKMFS